jgi:hypothetical protein
MPSFCRYSSAAFRSALATGHCFTGRVLAIIKQGNAEMPDRNPYAAIHAFSSTYDFWAILYVQFQLKATPVRKPADAPDLLRGLPQQFLLLAAAARVQSQKPPTGLHR